LGAFKHLGYKPEDFPVALACSRDILALPFHPYMTEADVNAIGRALEEALR
jgi:dTDP-4-amino-4,6-dideoxygalactose transaminase